MSNKIYAVRLKEYNKGAGMLLRNWGCARWKLHFQAGDATPKRPFRPSKIVEVTKEQFEYITGRNGAGVPNVVQPRSSGIPAFEGWTFEDRQQLLNFVNGEADQRASRGLTSARAVVVLKEGVHPSQRPEPAKVEIVHSAQPERNENKPDDDSDDFEPIDVTKELSKETTEERPAPSISKREAAKKYKAIKDGEIEDPTKKLAEEESNGDKNGDSEQKGSEEKSKPKTKKKPGRPPKKKPAKKQDPKSDD